MILHRFIRHMKGRHWTKVFLDLVIVVLVVFIYAKFRLVLSNTALLLGWHGNKRIPISDIQSVEVPDNPGTQICIKRVNGNKIQVSHWIEDHQQLGTRLQALVLGHKKKMEMASGTM